MQQTAFVERLVATYINLQHPKTAICKLTLELLNS